MRNRFAHNLVAHICLAAYLLVAVAGAGGLVWCNGSDGHKAVEWAHASSSSSLCAINIGPENVKSQVSNISYAPIDNHIAVNSQNCKDTSVAGDFTFLARGQQDCNQALAFISYMPLVGQIDMEVAARGHVNSCLASYLALPSRALLSDTAPLLGTVILLI